MAREPGELKNVIASTLRWLKDEQATLPEGLTHLKIMHTPTLAPVIDALGFTPIDYRFGFTCKAFDGALTLEDVAPERWYILPGD